MKKKLKIVGLLFTFSIHFNFIFAQLPKPACVGYWQNWSTNLKLTQIDPNYNVIQLAFATTVGTSLSNMVFNLPFNYSKTSFLADIDALHTKGKVVILSIGGANDPIRLDNTTAKDEFVRTINKILSDYSYKIDGIDLDFESSSFAFGTWSMTSPAIGQLNAIEAVKSIMDNYKTNTGKKLLLTMAPETVYLMGALSSYQITNSNGGAMLPILEGLKTELDLIHAQYYNAGGTGGGTVAVDGKIYYDNSNPNYITAMTESIIKGFTLLNNKGKYSGLPASKVAIGLPASNSTCDPGTGTGYNSTTDVCKAVKYLRGVISKPAGWTYTVTTKYPDLGGMMAWSINEDMDNTCNGVYSFAKNFPCAFDIVTSDDVQNLANTFSVSPNPVSDLLTISNPFSENITITVLDIFGKNVLSSELNAVSEKVVDLSSLKSGIYTVSLNSSTHKFVEKIIKN